MIIWNTIGITLLMDVTIPIVLSKVWLRPFALFLPSENGFVSTFKSLEILYFDRMLWIPTIIKFNLGWWNTLWWTSLSREINNSRNLAFSNCSCLLQNKKFPEFFKINIIQNECIFKKLPQSYHNFVLIYPFKYHSKLPNSCCVNTHCCAYLFNE